MACEANAACARLSAMPPKHAPSFLASRLVLVAGCVIELLLCLAWSPPAAFADATPSLPWVKSWNGPANHSDQPEDVAILPGGDILVVAQSYDPSLGSDRTAVIRYDQAGNVVWSIVDPGISQVRNVMVLSNGDPLIYGLVSNAGQWNLFLRRINASTGGTAWEKLHLVPYISDQFGAAVAEDPATGRLLVAATSQNDFLIMRYAVTDGAFIGELTWDGPQHTSDQATAIAPLPGGGFVVAGTEGNMQHGYRVIAYSQDGQILWTDHENGPIGNVFTRAWLGVDAAGDVLVAGGPETTCGLFSLSIWKISPAGQRLWTVNWPTANCASAEPTGFAMSPDGSVAMSAFSVGSGGKNLIAFHVDPAGAWWNRNWNDPPHNGVRGTDVAIDPAGNVIVAGDASTPGQQSDFAAVGWKPDGDLLFDHVDSIVPGANDTTVALAIDAARGFAITGFAFTAAQNSNVYTAWYQRPLPAADITADGIVNIDDLFEVINNWGPCPTSPRDCPADLDHSGAIDVDDLFAVINGWS